MSDCYVGNVFDNGRNALSISERARRVYSPNRSSRSSADGALRTGSSAGLGRSGLQPLSFLDEDDTFGSDSKNNDQDLLMNSSDSPAAIRKRSVGDSGQNNNDDPEKTPAWNPRPEGLAYYGIRLDNVEFEEQDLFERFKPIFDFDDAGDEDAKKQTVAAGGGDQDFYDNQNAKGAFQVTRGKIPGELDQTNDLLLL